MRPDEEYCASVFRSYLVSQGLEPVSYTPGSDPPDYQFAVAGKEHPVEVTSIVEPVPVGNREMLATAVSDSLSKAAEDLCSELMEQAWFVGSYALHVEPVPDLRANLPALRWRVFEYARSTASESQSEPHRLPYGWSIWKYSGESNLVAHSLCTSTCRTWQGEARETIRTLLDERIGIKSRHPDNDGDWVLLMLDRYHLADPVDWLQVIELIDTSRFRSVFRIGASLDCLPLAGNALL